MDGESVERVFCEVGVGLRASEEERVHGLRGDGGSGGLLAEDAAAIIDCHIDRHTTYIAHIV